MHLSKIEKEDLITKMNRELEARRKALNRPEYDSDQSSWGNDDDGF